MQPLYIFFKIGVFFATRIFFRQKRSINPPKKTHEPVILVSNHPSAFMDPILIGANQKLAIHFMVRADIFSKGRMWLFNGCQMIPIFRTREDGKESHQRNQESFARVRELLKSGKAILFFAEGYTDDVFIRSLKTIKKGPARVGFEAMAECDWSKPLKFQAIGLNYSHPQHMRSNLVMSYSEQIDIHDYRELYEENQGAALTAVTKELQRLMQGQITHAKNQYVADFAEDIMKLNRRGMNNDNYNFGIPLRDRFRYSRALAAGLNDSYDEEKESFDPQLTALRDKLSNYFSDQEKERVEEKWVYNKAHRPLAGVMNLLYLILFFPIFLAGLLPVIVPYVAIKSFVERNFKRKVFWSSAKLVLGYHSIAIFGIVLFLCGYLLVYPNIWIWLAYYFLGIPILFMLAYIYKKRALNYFRRLGANNSSIKSFVQRREDLLKELEAIDIIQNPDKAGI